MTDIFDLGFDKNLNKVKTEESNPLLYNVVRNELAAAMLSAGVSIGGSSGSMSLRSSDFISGSVGWALSADGILEASDARFRGTITGSTIDIPNSASPLFSVDSSGNVVVQSLRRKDFQWFTLFESLDGYQNNSTGTGTLSVDRNGANFATGATSTSRSWITKGPSGAGASFSWSKKRRIKMIVSFGQSNSSNSAYIVTGSVNAATDNHFGFFLATNGLLKGNNGDGTTEKETDLSTTIVAGTKYTLEAVWDGSGTILYYVDGTLKATVIANVPTGTDFPFVILDAYITNSAAADKTMIIYSYDFWQEG